MTSSISGGKPRLLVLASTYPRWGGDHEPGFVHELARRLVNQFEVTVLCPHADGAVQRERLDGVTVLRYRYAPSRLETLVHNGGIIANLKRGPWRVLLLPGFMMAQAWRAWRMVRDGGMDIIHAHWLVPQGMIATLLQALPGPDVPFVVTSHGADLYALRGRAWSLAKRYVASRAEAVTVVSSAMREEMRTLGVEGQKLSVLSMGVDVAGRFFPDASVDRSPDELLFVGRLVEKKGLEYLFRAMPAILRARPAARLTVAGFGPDEARLRALADSLGISGSIRFLGAVRQAELPALYRKAAVFVAPFVRAQSGDQEGLPVALMEAIACGCPIVAGDVAGLRDMLGGHADEVAVDPRDERVLSNRVLRALSMPDVERARAERMSAYVRSRFDWDAIAARYAEVLLKAKQGSSK